MDLDLVRLALTVAKNGSLAGAARALGRDPSVVSRGLATLEAELGIRLFERSTRSLAITEAGARFLDRAAPLLEGFDDARERARGGGSEPTGTLRVTTSVAFAHEALIPAIAGFRARYQALGIDLMLSDRPLDLVAEGLDLALRLAPAPTGDLVSTRLRPTRYRVVATPAWVAAAEPLDTPAALADHDVLRLPLPPYRDRWRFRARDGTETVVAVHGSLTISNPLALRAAVLAGLGPALLADWMTDADLRQGRLVDLLPAYAATATEFDTAVWALYPSRRYLPRKTRAMLDHLRAAWRVAGAPA